MLFEMACIGLGVLGLASKAFEGETLTKRLDNTFENVGMRIRKNGRIIKPKIIRKFKTRYGWHYILTIPPGLCREDFERKIPELRDALFASDVIVEKKKHLHLHFITEDLTRPYKYSDDLLDLLKTPYEVPLGIDVLGRFHTFDFTTGPHTLIAGATGGGKTNLLHLILTVLHKRNTPDSLRLHLADYKGKGFKKYENSPLIENIIYDFKETGYMLSKIEKEYNSRVKLLDKLEFDDINDIINPPPRHLVIIDEYADLSPEEDKQNKTEKGKIQERFIRLARKARFVGIHIIVATQRPTVKVLPGNMKTNFPVRISTPMPSHHDSEVILDTRSAADIEKVPGRIIFKQGLEEIEIQTPLITKENMCSLPRNHASIETHETEEYIEFTEDDLK